MRPLISFARSFKHEESMGSSTGQEQQRAGAVAATGKLSWNASFPLPQGDLRYCLICRFRKLSQTLFLAVLRIHDILVWIRIRGSMSLTSGFGSRSCFFVIDLQDAKKLLLKVFLLNLKVHLHHISKIKSHEEVTKQYQSFSYYFCLMIEGSGSWFGSATLVLGLHFWSSKTWIRIRSRWIWIRNTGGRSAKFIWSAAGWFFRILPVHWPPGCQPGEAGGSEHSCWWWGEREAGAAGGRAQWWTGGRTGRQPLVGPRPRYHSGHENSPFKKVGQADTEYLWWNSSAIYDEQGLRHITVKHWCSHVWLTQGVWCVSCEQLPAVNTWVKLIEIQLLICTMAAGLSFIKKMTKILAWNFSRQMLLKFPWKMTWTFSEEL